MFDVIIESKHIELTELQLRFLSKHSKFINKFIILINSNDALIDFKLKLLKHQINIDFEIIPYSKLVNKNLFNFIDSNFNENKKYLFVSAFVSYFEQSFLDTLNQELEQDNSRLYFPQILNTERVFYIHQVMGIHKSFTNGRWNNDYLDSEELLDFNNWDKNFLLNLSKKYLTMIKLGSVDRLKFDKYHFLPNEILPLYCFCWENNLLINDNFIEKEKIIVGDSICSLFCKDSLVFNEYLKSGFLSKHVECLYFQNEDQYKQLEFEFIYDDSQLSFDFQEDDNISIENKLKQIFANSSKSPEIKFVINTYINQNKYIYEKLINSLISNSIDPKNIYLVIGGCEEEKSEINLINYHYVKHNSYDHTGLIEIIDKNITSDYWFVLHDTCSVGPNFYSKLLKKSFSEHNPILEEGWLNMGLFSQKFIEKNKKYILSLRNCDKMQAILSEKMYPRLGKSFYLNSIRNYDLQSTFDVYGDGVERSVVYFSEIDLYKYQTYYHNSDISIKLFESRVIKKDTII